MQLGLQQSDITSVFQALDVTGDGEIEWDEFRVAFKPSDANYYLEDLESSFLRCMCLSSVLCLLVCLLFWVSKSLAVAESETISGIDMWRTRCLCLCLCLCLCRRLTLQGA